LFDFISSMAEHDDKLRQAAAQTVADHPFKNGRPANGQQAFGRGVCKGAKPGANASGKYNGHGRAIGFVRHHVNS
jgi:hypothetical protein